MAETMPDDDLPRSRCRSRSRVGEQFIHICIYLTYLALGNEAENDDGAGDSEEGRR